jgi:hypothetical protein
LLANGNIKEILEDSDKDYKAEIVPMTLAGWTLLFLGIAAEERIGLKGIEAPCSPAEAGSPLCSDKLAVRLRRIRL